MLTLEGPPAFLKRALTAAIIVIGLCSYNNIPLRGPHRERPNIQRRFKKLATIACLKILNICDRCRPLHVGLCKTRNTSADLQRHGV